jgi:hypothetical protein
MKTLVPVKIGKKRNLQLYFRGSDLYLTQKISDRIHFASDLKFITPMIPSTFATLRRPTMAPAIFCLIIFPFFFWETKGV